MTLGCGIEVEILFISLQRIKRPACPQAGCNAKPEQVPNIVYLHTAPNFFTIYENAL